MMAGDLFMGIFVAVEVSASPVAVPDNFFTPLFPTVPCFTCSINHICVVARPCLCLIAKQGLPINTPDIVREFDVSIGCLERFFNKSSVKLDSLTQKSIRKNYLFFS